MTPFFSDKDSSRGRLSDNESSVADFDSGWSTTAVNITVFSSGNPELPKFLSCKLGVGQNIALYASSTARNSVLFSCFCVCVFLFVFCLFCFLFVCLFVYLFFVVLGVLLLFCFVCLFVCFLFFSFSALSIHSTSFFLILFKCKMTCYKSGNETFTCDLINFKCLVLARPSILTGS